MTVKEIITRLNLDVKTLTQKQRDILTLWLDTDLRVSRIARDGKLSKAYQLADVTRTELVRLIRDILDGKSPPSVLHLFEGE